MRIEDTIGVVIAVPGIHRPHRNRIGNVDAFNDRTAHQLPAARWGAGLVHKVMTLAVLMIYCVPRSYSN